MKLIILLSSILVLIATLFYFYKKREDFDNTYSSIVSDLEKEANKGNTTKAPFGGSNKRKSLEDQFKELENLENKCHDYFKSIKNLN